MPKHARFNVQKRAISKPKKHNFSKLWAPVKKKLFHKIVFCLRVPC